ncbi:MAG: trigger factor [Eubacteriales bacterium]|nr:trigger factor [Eubacteriales bacterium]MDY3333119.1 trigger factor [Gallibacter sp.]
MKTTLLSKENGEAKFTVEFTVEEFNAAKVKAYQDTKDQFVVDGFRKGKAPRSIIEKKYGENVFTEEAINEMVNTNYGPALDELELEVIDQPRIEFGKIEKDQPFDITVTVAIYPEVKVENYKGIELEKVDGEVTEEDIETELTHRQKSNARMIVVDREVKDGDHVVLDYSGFVGEDQFEGGTAENQSLHIGSGTFIPGFEEQLVGAKKEEEVEVKVTFPEQYHSADLAGKDAIFKCVVHEVKEEELPELDDEFAKDVSEFDTLDELKEDIKKNLQERKTAWAENQMKGKALEAVIKANEISPPSSMIFGEVDQMIQEFNGQLSQQGLSLDTYLQYIGKDAKDFREELKEEAKGRVESRMVMRAIAELENIEATDEDVDGELEMMAMQYGMEKEKVREAIGETTIGYIKKDIAMRKAVDFIYDNAKIK